MLNGLISTVKEDASRTAERGALYVYAGVLALVANVFVAAAIVMSLAPVIGMGLALLCGGVFLFILAGVFFLIAMAKGQSSASSYQGAHASKQSASSTGSGEMDYASILASSLSNGMLERELKDHPIRMLAAALAAGTVMGMMEEFQSDK